jgi:post-segregation antitoxin (ccd killing protein)
LDVGEKAPSSATVPLTAVERARAFGVDISLLMENLRLTPKERLEKAQEAARSLAALQTEAEKGRKGTRKAE